MVRSRVMIRVHSCSFIGNLGHIPSMMVCMVVHYLGAAIRQGHGVGTWQQQNIVRSFVVLALQNKTMCLEYYFLALKFSIYCTLLNEDPLFACLFVCCFFAYETGTPAILNHFLV